MTTPTRSLLLALLVLLAGCAVSVTDRDATAGGASPSVTDGSAAPNATPASLAFEPAERIRVRVTEVVDGDTVDVRLPDGSEETVRLLGVDTPEVHAENDPAEFEGVPDTEAGRTCLRAAGSNATEYVRARLAGEEATLLLDPRSDRRGGYGRLLAYVAHDGRNLNYALVATGHARVYDSTFALRSDFDAAEAETRAAGRGVWQCQNAG